MPSSARRERDKVSRRQRDSRERKKRESYVAKDAAIIATSGGSAARPLSSGRELEKEEEDEEEMDDLRASIYDPLFDEDSLAFSSGAAFKTQQVCVLLICFVLMLTWHFSCVSLHILSFLKRSPLLSMTLYSACQARLLHLQ